LRRERSNTPNVERETWNAHADRFASLRARAGTSYARLSAPLFSRLAEIGENGSAIERQFKSDA